MGLAVAGFLQDAAGTVKDSDLEDHSVVAETVVGQVAFASATQNTLSISAVDAVGLLETDAAPADLEWETQGVEAWDTVAEDAAVAVMRTITFPEARQGQ